LKRKIGREYGLFVIFHDIVLEEEEEDLISGKDRREA
jgi:hypothetical protein